MKSAKIDPINICVKLSVAYLSHKMAEKANAVTKTHQTALISMYSKPTYIKKTNIKVITPHYFI